MACVEEAVPTGIGATRKSDAPIPILRTEDVSGPNFPKRADRLSMTHRLQLLIGFCVYDNASNDGRI